MNPTDRLMAYAQICLATGILGFCFFIILVYEMGWAKIPAGDQTFASALDWTKGVAFLVAVFWFQRARAAGLPDPSQTITQTHTAADGTKTVIVSPATTPAGAPNAPPSATPSASLVTIQTPAATITPASPIPPTTPETSP